MKLHILSDLHIEYAEFTPPPTGAGTVILAGDIGVGSAGVLWAGRSFPRQTVLYVPGNHEFYEQDIDLVPELRKAAPENVQVLDNEEAELDGIRFLGSTLWTDFAFDGDANAEALDEARRFIRDFSVIRNGERLFTPEDSVVLHQAGRRWLEARLEEPFAGPTVVITHHLPAARSTAGPYAASPLNPAFASRLEPLIERYSPVLWIHGHTHVPCDYRLGATRVVCNPRGYPRETYDTAFDPALVVDV